MTKVLCVTLKWGTRTDHVQILCFSKHQTNSFITFVSLLCGNEVWVDLFLNSKVILHKNSEKRVLYLWALWASCDDSMTDITVLSS